MIIKSIDLFHICLPLKFSFETSFGVIDKRPALIIKFTTQDGIQGYGESSPLYVPISEDETLDIDVDILKKILPKLINVEIEDISKLDEICNTLPGYPVAKIGIQGAYFHALAQEKNLPINKIFNKDASNSIKVGESVGIQKTIEATLKETEKFMSKGFSRIKVKIKPSHDYEILKQVRKHFPDVMLGADANSAYTINDIPELQKLDELNLAFMEQPFAADDYEAFTEYKQTCSTPICLDETILSLKTCLDADKLGFCDMVNIKPARIGSFTESIKIHDFCVERGIPLFGGGRLETGIGRHLNAALYSLPGFTLPADMTPPVEYFPEDITEPAFQVQNGSHTITPIFKVREDLLEKYLIEQITFRSLWIDFSCKIL